MRAGARPLGDEGVLVDVEGGHRQAQALARTIAAREVVPGAASVGVVGPFETVADPGPSRRPVRHDVGVVFDGADLEELGLTGGEAAGLLADHELEVAWLGFMPGFAYLVGLPDRLARIERRPSPRTRVPAGSVAVGGGYAGIYPGPSPGGWNLLGRTDFCLFDPFSPPYALLQPGDTIRVHRVDELGEPPTPTRQPLGGDALEVLDPGPLLLLEDAGRTGCGHLGVPRAGSANDCWHRLANRAVGNEEWAGALELTGSARFRARRGLFVALAGEAPLAVGGTVLPPLTVGVAGAGQLVEAGPVARYGRAVLAVAGGLTGGPSGGPLFKSVSGDAVSGLPPGRLVKGDVLGLGARAGRPRLRLELLRPGEGARRLRVVAGPDGGPGVLRGEWSVDPRSDRTGIRLHRPDATEVGPVPLASVPSHAVVPGAVQLPPNGEPVVLGPDCGPVGGYPVVGVVISADRWLLGTLVPGDAVVFEAVSLEQAAAARGDLEATIARSVTGHFPTSVA